MEKGNFHSDNLKGSTLTFLDLTGFYDLDELVSNGNRFILDLPFYNLE